MKKLRVSRLRKVAFIGLMVTLTLMAAFAFVTRTSLANDNNVKSDDSQVVNSGESEPEAAQVSASPVSMAQEVLSTQLSYYFVGGQAFAPDSDVPYFKRSDGCVDGLPLDHDLIAPVHLPQGSQVVSITLYSKNIISESKTSRGSFDYSDGMGGGVFRPFYTYSTSPKAGFSQDTSSQINPLTIDNQNYYYLVRWRLMDASGTLSLCGIRVAYYAPVGAALFLPAVSR